MSNHTTGPWYVRNILGRGVEVHWKDDNEHPICHMRWSDGFREVVELRIDADARLIAACPTMYAYIARQANDGDSEAAAILEQINAK